MRREVVLYMVLFCALCSIISGCTNESVYSNSSDIPSENEFSVIEDNNVSLEESSKNIDTSSSVNFIDSELKKCVEEILNIVPNEMITTDMCESITEIDCSGKKISTLEDLKLFPNLNKIVIDNGDTYLNLKGINKCLELKYVTLKNCQLKEVDRLAYLKKLEYLDISSRNKIMVSDYSSLSALTKLKTLNMYCDGYNQYNVYSLYDGSFLDSLTNLEELNIYNACIKNYSLVKLKKLKKLIIYECKFDDILNQMCESGSISLVEELYVYANSLSNDGIKNCLSNAKNLKKLTLYGISSKVTSLEGLGDLQNLEYLDIDNRETHYLPLSCYNELTKLNKLTELRIKSDLHTVEDRKNKKQDDYSFLSKIKSLETLYIGTYDGMKISSLIGLNKLKKLVLVGGRVFDKDEIDISGIEKLMSLKELLYNNVQFKSSVPLDDLDYLTVELISNQDLMSDNSGYN